MSLLPVHSVFVEIGQQTLAILDGNHGFELPLERSSDGHLTDACRTRLISTLQGHLRKYSWGRRQRAICAVGARGVALRRIVLPQAAAEEFSRLLELQIESEFPLPPEALAWGYLPLGGTKALQPGAPAHELLVAAVKREVIQEYANLLSACGLTPTFTLAALARLALCPTSASGASALLDIGSQRSELITLEGGVPATLRVIPWGTDDLAHVLEQALRISRTEAKALMQNPPRSAAAEDDRTFELQQCVRAQTEELASMIGFNGTESPLYLSGEIPLLPDFALALAQSLGIHSTCQPVHAPSSPGWSAATVGLKKSAEIGANLLALEIRETKRSEPSQPPSRWQWAVAACMLAVAVMSFRYAEALFLQPRLLKKVTEIKARQQGLPHIDRELGFLQHLEQTQLPFLDAIYVISKAAPGGARLDSLSLTRRGDISMRGTLRDALQAVAFRTNLIESGFFSTVVVDEQTPTPDRQKLNFRITAQIKPLGERPSLPIEPVPQTSPGKPGLLVQPPGAPAALAPPIAVRHDAPGQPLPPQAAIQRNVLGNPTD